jgi:hypothetical protein
VCFIIACIKNTLAFYITEVPQRGYSTSRSQKTLIISCFRYTVIDGLMALEIVLSTNSNFNLKIICNS